MFRFRIPMGVGSLFRYHHITIAYRSIFIIGNPKPDLMMMLSFLLYTFFSLFSSLSSARYRDSTRIIVPNPVRIIPTHKRIINVYHVNHTQPSNTKNKREKKVAFCEQISNESGSRNFPLSRVDIQDLGDGPTGWSVNGEIVADDIYWLRVVRLRLS